MNKFNFAGVALVGAIPGAFLVFLLVKMFMTHADKAGGMMLAVAGLTLIAAATVALMPVLILIFNPGMPSVPKETVMKEKPAKASKPDKKAKGKKGKDAEPEPAMMGDDDFGNDDLEPTIDHIDRNETDDFVTMDMDDDDHTTDFVDIGEVDDEDDFK